jgi:RNA polymerase sigma-70 factor (ECF subfamily)
MSNLNGITEEELIQKCKAGNLKDLEKLYKHFYGYAMGVGFRYLADREDVLEVVNDAFIKVFKSIHTYNTTMSFKPWLRKVVVNTALDRYRKNQRQVEMVGLEKANEITGRTFQTDDLTVKEILKLLDALPELQRVVFNMYEIDGYSHEEIGTMLNIPASSSRVYLARAKEKLRSVLLKAAQI